jgi:hypothetical protein
MQNRFAAIIWQAIVRAERLTICDITGHSYRSAQTIVKHYRARNADRADAGIDRLELQVRKEGMTG